MKMLRRKRVWLTMQQRLNVIKDLETYSIQCVAKKYNVHPKTIKRIRERAAKIYNLAEKGKVEKRRKNFREPKYADLEERLYVWFAEMKCLGETVSDALLLQKARELKEEFGDSNFKLSDGWLRKFKRRHYIRLVRKFSEDEDEESTIEEEDEERAIEEEDEEDEEMSTEEEDEEMAAEEGAEERAKEEGDEERAAQEGNEERTAEAGNEERAKEEGDEGRVTQEGVEVNWIQLPSKIRKDFEVLFKKFKALKKYLPPPARHQLEALKLTVLGYSTSKKRKLP